MTSVVVLGQGYVGLPLAVRAAEVGFDVLGFDIDTRRVELLSSGDSFIEDIESSRLKSVIDAGRYRASSDGGDLRGFDIAVISVPTPLRDSVPDLSFVESAAMMIAPHLRAGCTVILESTTYPGTTEELVAPLLEGESHLTAGVDFHLGYSPERIDPGNTTWTFERTPKVVSGVTPASLHAVRSFFDELVETTVPVASPKEAELTKLLENTFRHVNIALVNELAMFANDLGINIWDAIEAADTKPFGFMKFTPGPGVGGHCLPIDPSYLSWRVRQTLGHTFRFVELANDINGHMPDYVVERVAAALNDRGLSVSGRRILLLGLAYKRNTGDVREAPSLDVVRLLLERGAEVRAVDPYVDPAMVPRGVDLVDLDAKELAAADVAVLLVDHDGFDLAMIQTESAFVLDCRNVLVGDTVEPL